MRKWIAMKLVYLARHIYPWSTDVSAFYMDIVAEAAMRGEAAYKISRVDLRDDIHEGTK